MSEDALLESRADSFGSLGSNDERLWEEEKEATAGRSISLQVALRISHGSVCN